MVRQGTGEAAVNAALDEHLPRDCVRLAARMCRPGTSVDVGQHQRGGALMELYAKIIATGLELTQACSAQRWVRPYSPWSRLRC